MSLIFNPTFFMDLYELTMAQGWYQKGMKEIAYFEVMVRKLPEHWGFFVMAGLSEIQTYLSGFRFTDDDIEYLDSTKLFTEEFLLFLGKFIPQVRIRALPEGTIFFPNEPILEVSGDIISTQVLESYVLNILGFSILETSLATRIVMAAQNVPVVDFGLRRSQGPIASLRSARAAQIAGFKGTSNLFASKILGFNSTGTMAHSFVQSYENEECAFDDYAKMYHEDAVLLVDTYDTTIGTHRAAVIANCLNEQKGIKIKGIRIDSGDFMELSKHARKTFQEKNVDFLKIFVSGNLDEFKIYDLMQRGAEIDGFGVGTNFAVSQNAPSLEIVYKLVQYGERGISKNSPGKVSKPGRKSILRRMNSKDMVLPYSNDLRDLLKPFVGIDSIQVIQERLTIELSSFEDSVKRIRNPRIYPVINCC